MDTRKADTLKSRTAYTSTHWLKQVICIKQTIVTLTEIRYVTKTAFISEELMKT
jgi:hypothetical protein